MNYTIMEGIPEGGHVLVGMFSLNGYPIILLFDSSATHDFISKAYTQKYHLAIAQTNTPYMISTLGGNVNESASRPLVGFGVLNDNLIKGPMSFVKCMSRF
jgi:hypothetical protein